MAEVKEKPTSPEQPKVVSIRVLSEFKLACMTTGRTFNSGVITEGVPHTPWLDMQVAAGLVEILK